MTLFHVKSDHLARLLLLLDLLLLSLVFVVILQLYPLLGKDELLDVSAHLGLLPVILITFSIARRWIGNTTALQRASIRAEIGALLREILFTFSIIASWIFLLKLQFVSRSVLLGFVVVAAIVLILMRVFLIWWYFIQSKEKLENYLNVLIVGSGQRAHNLADRLQTRFEWGVNIVGFLDPRGVSAGRRWTDDILGHVDQISEVLRESVIDEVIVAVPRSMLGDVRSIIDACQEEGVHLRFMADIFDFDAARVRLAMVDNIPMLSFETVARGENALIAKRIFDLFVTLAALPIVLPFLALVAFAIKIDSPGPALFIQERIGLHKRTFRFFKFRSMVNDAEAKMSGVEHLNEADGPNFKIANDTRITRLGRMLRRTSVDELPQLFNVLRGDMSLVGPRPMTLRDVALFDKGIQRKRFTVRPGITCLWQVSGRSNLSFDEWLALDLKYIDSWSLYLDIKILLMTVPTVLKREGAV